MSSVVIKQMLEQEQEQLDLFVKFKKFLDQLEQEEDSEVLLQDKKKPVKNCVKGNDKHLPAGHPRGGQFAKKGELKGQGGSTSIANKSTKTGCRKGRARISPDGREKFIPHAQNCGRINQRNKCSEPKPRVKESIQVPDRDQDGFVSVYEFSKALDKQQQKLKTSQEQVSHLQRAIKKLKASRCESISAGRLAAMARTMARALKGQEPEKAP